jgi:anti-sigma regulatory factor (Ser/Thr protein kinase)
MRATTSSWWTTPTRSIVALALAIAVDALVIEVVPRDYPANVAAGVMLVGILGTTLLGGRVLGILAALLGVGVFDYFFLEPREELGIETPAIFGVIVYAFVAFTTVMLVSAFQTSLARVRRSEIELNESLIDAQRALLPGPVPTIEFVDLGRCYRPAGEGHAGGDWYTIVPLDDHRIGLGVGDAAGHGVAALGLMARARFAMLAYARLELPPGEVLGQMNRLVLNAPTGETPFVTATFGVLDRATMTWTEARAGHPPTVLRHADGGVEIVGPDNHGLVLGVDPHARYVETTHALSTGDTVALYTDGLVERPGRDVYDGIAALMRELETLRADDLDEACTELADRLGTARDDVALLVATVNSSAAPPSHYEHTFRADPAEIAILRRGVADWLAGRLPERTTWAITLALSEAATNAIEHGCHCDGISYVDVAATHEDGHIRMTVHDPGDWSNTAPGLGRGRGLDMMKALMDRVAVEHGADGTTVHLELAVRPTAPGPGDSSPRAGVPQSAE